MRIEVSSGMLCPVRSDGGNIEVLLTRRSFWNHEKNRPMRYPGEWVFAGGKSERTDGSLAHTAVREFREELCYDGDIKVEGLFYSFDNNTQDRYFSAEFYRAKIESSNRFKLQDKGEVIDFRWMDPLEAICMINSDEFTKEQLADFRKMRLDNEDFGVYAVYKRQVPLENIQALSMLYLDYKLGLIGFE